MKERKTRETPIVAEDVSEEERYKAIAFYLVRLHRVGPDGAKKKKTREEVDAMTVATIEHMAKNLSAKILEDYRAAANKSATVLPCKSNK